jgi:RNA polymerase sigma-70 factor, ECF subfamily
MDPWIALLRQAQTADKPEQQKQALGQLFEQTYSCLANAARRCKRRQISNIDEEDLIHETWLRAASRLHQFRGRSAGELGAWLGRIATNTYLNLLAHADRHSPDGAHGAAIDAESNSLAVANSVDSVATPSRVLQAQDLSDLIREALENLDPHHRQIVEMRMLKQMTFEQIADELLPKTGKDNVRKIFHRALRSLAAYVRRHGSASSGILRLAAERFAGRDRASPNKALE